MSGVRPDLMRMLLPDLITIKANIQLTEFESKRMKLRNHTPDARRAKLKRISKRRAKKGYK